MTAILPYPRIDLLPFHGGDPLDVLVLVQEPSFPG
ncbi:MAG: inorganic diphosphatase [Acidimicrobiia bacterium]|nr:inorganic diphosphatase [Acidimicrobiia bacterium]